MPRKLLFNLNDADQEKLEALRVAWGIKTTVDTVRRLIREAQAVDGMLAGQPSEVAALVASIPPLIGLALLVKPYDKTDEIIKTVRAALAPFNKEPTG